MIFVCLDFSASLWPMRLLVFSYHTIGLKYRPNKAFEIYRFFFLFFGGGNDLEGPFWVEIRPSMVPGGILPSSEEGVGCRTQ